MRQWEIWVWYLLHLRSFATRSTDPVAWAFETAPTMSHCTERVARATEGKDFLSHWARECYFHLLVLISSYSSWIPFFFLAHLEDSLATNLQGDTEVIYLRNTRPRLWTFGVGQSPTTNLKFWVLLVKSQEKPPNHQHPQTWFFSVAAQACRVGFSPTNRDDGSEIPLSEQLL